jgi:hypothetical protein
MNQFDFFMGIFVLPRPVGVADVFVLFFNPRIELIMH